MSILCKYKRIAVAQLPKELCGSLSIGEEESHRPRRRGVCEHLSSPGWAFWRRDRESLFGRLRPAGPASRATGLFQGGRKRPHILKTLLWVFGKGGEHHLLHCKRNGRNLLTQGG